jgi:hypothetical protein
MPSAIYINLSICAYLPSASYTGQKKLNIAKRDLSLTA